MEWFSDLQVSDVKRLLVDVDGVRPCSQTPHGRQVTAVAPHGLDDEDPPLGAAGRLFDAVTRLNDREFSKHRTVLDRGLVLFIHLSLNRKGKDS